MLGGCTSSTELELLNIVRVCYKLPTVTKGPLRVAREGRGEKQGAPTRQYPLKYGAVRVRVRVYGRTV